MKVSILLSAILVTKLYLVAAQTVNNSTSTPSSCYETCEDFDQYCEVSTGVCRGPRYDGECFNPATGAFQDGCDPGFACVDNKCDFLEEIAEATEADSSSASGCSEDAQCSVFGEYCDSDLNECRAPIDGECYDAASGVFTDGCAEGYECLDGLCQVHTTTTDDSVCYLTCSAGEYCENGANECRSPGYDGECFNPATGHYQNGCDPGFTCSNNQCSYA
ncbi:hypothetical protein PHYSODRAFT_301260 [Phytophthora sojae]|uniref:Uncharacterized protein n=1 Tax=Phytophthora sojae (strain P6497) TaxID=1094619 RepID=G4ZHQ5_PHYSP|nr:hypothetical protein PHYSODRAFT_301260 [Phytophthora sojae]EGZ18710.1 hypothetical protein PHYSODRAFT_301260 [Phytophthora sojae]|eukprot:XP_009527768.1 hypothetical protein PHYSODRAFT_301260 [Phytophthora sojae]